MSARCNAPTKFWWWDGEKRVPDKCWRQVKAPGDHCYQHREPKP